jgi:hypothetical protein
MDWRMFSIEVGKFRIDCLDLMEIDRTLEDNCQQCTCQVFIDGMQTPSGVLCWPCYLLDTEANSDSLTIIIRRDATELNDLLQQLQHIILQKGAFDASDNLTAAAAMRSTMCNSDMQGAATKKLHMPIIVEHVAGIQYANTKT